jgi:alkane 1-monooxygenase
MAGINGLVGHELIHKKRFIHKFMGTFTYTKIMYSHFVSEHTSGHHKFVATPEDPATALKGEIFYTFWLRSIRGGFVNSCRREKERTEYICDHD